MSRALGKCNFFPFAGRDIRQLRFRYRVKSNSGSSSSSSSS
jgi:hypothetical protein